MLGGYLSKRREEKLERRFRESLGGSIETISRQNKNFYAWCFYSSPLENPFHQVFASPELLILSQGPLVGGDADSGYRSLDLKEDFLPLYKKYSWEALNRIQSNFNMIVIEYTRQGPYLYLVSHRASWGRMYYRIVEGGIIFCSNFLTLLKLLPATVNNAVLFSLLKYGAVLGPETLAREIRSCPVAHFLRYDLLKDGISAKSFFKFNFVQKPLSSKTSPEEFLLPIRRVLAGYARFLYHSRSKILLSGGVDSTLFTCLMSSGRKESSVQAYFCSFGEEDPELPYARKAAKISGAHLHILHLTEPREIISLMQRAPQFYSTPFSDVATLPTVFLMEHIKKDAILSSIIVDGDGAGSCFASPFPDLADRLRLACRFPPFLRNMAKTLYMKGEFWKSKGKLNYRLFTIARCCEPYFQLSPLVKGIFPCILKEYSREWESLIGEGLGTALRDCSEIKGDGRSRFLAELAIAEILFLISSRYCLKTGLLGEKMGQEVEFPFLWYDILRESERLPWEIKEYKGIYKWPLKRLLEDYAPADFVHREKGFFIPPLWKWFKEPAIFDFLWSTLLSRKGVVKEIIPEKELKSLLEKVHRGEEISRPVFHLLWSALFLELWMNRNWSCSGKGE